MSHYVECKPGFKDREALIAALLAVGFDRSQIEIHEEAVSLYGYQGDERPVLAVVLTPGGRRVVSVSDHAMLRIWDLASGNCERELGYWVNAVAISLGGQRAVLASSSWVLSVWDLATGDCERTLRQHEDWISAVAVTPDGRRAVSASSDKTLKVWDLATGELLASFTGEGAMGACAVAPDGRTVVCGELNGRVHFLRLVETGVAKEAVSDQ